MLTGGRGEVRERIMIEVRGSGEFLGWWNCLECGDGVILQTDYFGFYYTLICNP